MPGTCKAVLAFNMHVCIASAITYKSLQVTIRFLKTSKTLPNHEIDRTECLATNCYQACIMYFQVQIHN